MQLQLLCIPLVAGEDYTRRTTTLSFGSCGRRSCTTVAITNDWTVEPSVEMFTVSLAAVNDDTRIRVRTLNSTVSICDDDGTYVNKNCVHTSINNDIMLLPHRLRGET